jgi:integrase
MARRNAENLRIKRRYLVWLKEAKGLSEPSIDKAAAAVDSFEEHAKRRSFKAFHSEQARAFKRHLDRSTNTRTGKPLSAATIDGTLRELKGFFRWLADQPGYKSRISYSDAEFFNPSHKVARQAQARLWKPHPTPEQIQHVLRMMKTTTILERRDRAVIAFLFLTGSRDGAAASLRLRHVDLVEDCVHFDGREVRTKRSKSFTTWFFPVGGEVQQIVVDWITELREVHLWGQEDPIFPRTLVAVGNTGGFFAAGIDRTPWKSAGSIRKIFPAAFRNAGLPEFNPHRVRDTLAELGNKLCKSPEELKAWSQNLGHNDVMTTLMNYGSVAPGRQGEIIKGLREPKD